MRYRIPGRKVVAGGGGQEGRVGTLALYCIDTVYIRTYCTLLTIMPCPACLPLVHGPRALTARKEQEGARNGTRQPTQVLLLLLFCHHPSFLRTGRQLWQGRIELEIAEKRTFIFQVTHTVMYYYLQSSCLKYASLQCSCQTQSGQIVASSDKSGHKCVDDECQLLDTYCIVHSYKRGVGGQCHLLCYYAYSNMSSIPIRFL